MRQHQVIHHSSFLIHHFSFIYARGQVLKIEIPSTKIFPR